MATNLERRVTDLEHAQAAAEDDYCACWPYSVRLAGADYDGNETCPKCGRPIRITIILEYVDGKRGADDPATE